MRKLLQEVVHDGVVGFSFQASDWLWGFPTGAGGRAVRAMVRRRNYTRMVTAEGTRVGLKMQCVAIGHA